MLCRGLLIAAALMLPVCGIATDARAQAPDKPSAAAPLPSTAEYQSKLATYTKARQKFDDEAAAYWGAVTQKQRQRNATRRDHEETRLDYDLPPRPPVYVSPPPPSPPSPAPLDAAHSH